MNHGGPSGRARSSKREKADLPTIELLLHLRLSEVPQEAQRQGTHAIDRRSVNANTGQSLRWHPHSSCGLSSPTGKASSSDVLPTSNQTQKARFCKITTNTIHPTALLSSLK